jgi:hypothetical protein
MPRRGGAFRSLLRVLRSRDGSRRNPSSVVEVVAGGGACAPGRRLDLRHRSGRPSSCEVARPSIDSGAARTRRRSCGVRDCDGRTMSRQSAAADLPAASALVRADTRCRLRGRASSGGPRRQAPQGRGLPRGRPVPGASPRDVPRRGPCSAAQLQRMGRQPPAEVSPKARCRIRGGRGPKHASHHNT